MVDPYWLSDFSERLRQFEDGRGEGCAVSIKIRATGGCFHREHSPEAYRLIDEYLNAKPPNEYGALLEEHESGPELLVWLVGAVLAKPTIELITAIINLVTAVVTARQQGIVRGDNRTEPLQIIARRMNGPALDERDVITVSSARSLTRGEIEMALRDTLKDMIKEDLKNNAGRQQSSDIER